jgi:5-methyltetrahydrofolate--homocysteine methyltransferase
MSNLLESLRHRVLLCDGAMGTRIQALELDVERDFQDKENCSEILNLSRPDIVRDIHMSFFTAGADIVETNSFGGSPLTLAEFGLAERAFEINKRAGELAREAADKFRDDGRPRFVFGSIGPGTRLPSLGQVDYDALLAAYAEQCAGLLAGGVDALLVETCQDPLQIKAAVAAAKDARDKAGKSRLPIIVQVTVETTGTLLVGTDIAAVSTVVDALGVEIIGLNCATGPQEMASHLGWLAQNWRGLISVQPNAGLPELVEGEAHYPLTPAELAAWLERFLTEDGVNLIGGCCGTTPEHISAIDRMLRGLAADGYRPEPKARRSDWVPGVASLYGQVAYRQENAYFSIGERCNANGSRRFRELQEKTDWDGCVAMGTTQAREGSHAIDVCTAFVGRNEAADMSELVSRLCTAVDAPVVLDSTEYPVLETAIKLYGGKPVINSINFEDGEEPAARRLALARRFGAAVVALTIDEAGMAKKTDRKLEIARRLHDFACGQHGLPPEDLILDPLTFTICTGNEEDRELGLWTLEAIERIARELPACQIILGLSNISFGLDPTARHVLNSVFLDHAQRRGLTGAIVHLSKIVPLHKIPEKEVKAAEDLIFNRRTGNVDPLHAFIALFQGRKAEATAPRQKASDLETRLKDRIIDGDRQGLDDDLSLALQKYAPLDIINTHLMNGMKVVGELFGAGKMQLPFVLQSAETMKAAVAFLEPHMDRIEGQQKGTIVLATVKGDVHDIGKNLVDIILTNNGYKVINLGIKQPIENILAAAREHQADAIGMSGLLVKSTVVMRENLERMSAEGLEIPVFLGGAALTRDYVERDCVDAYACGRVAYARNAFDGLQFMDAVVTGTFDQLLAERISKAAASTRRTNRSMTPKGVNGQHRFNAQEIRAQRARMVDGIEVPAPPFWGSRMIDGIPLPALLPYLNERMVYQFHWGYRKAGRSLDDYLVWASKELRPMLMSLLDLVQEQKILQPQAVYGYWPANAEGNDIVIYDPDHQKIEIARFSLPRQGRDGGLCVADFLRDASTGEHDLLGLQLVTVGPRAAEVGRQWMAEDRYRDYLFLHGLGVEMAEALAEYLHKRIRAELGFGHMDARDPKKLLQQGYQGSRYSFGYPACPNLEDQGQVMELLGAGRIGVQLSDEAQLHPEQSTSAIVIHHPAARYFTV